MNESVTTKYDAQTVTGWLDGMLTPLMKLIDPDIPVALIGIRRGGVNVATYLLDQLKDKSVNVEQELAELNIAFYRDDFSSVGLHPVVGPSQVPFDLEDKHIVLVDDVLGTGRTVRAAMNEIFDYGRPARITLAVLVQRTGHELPIRADVVGHNLDVDANQYIDLDSTTMQVSVGEKS
ncbi:MAG: pyrimidine operon attenuation protein/uracil phosphoribosyltransferase [bacterium]